MSQVITLEECERQVGIWKDALEAISEGKSYQIGDRILSFDSTDMVRKTLNEWIARKNRLVKKSKRGKGFRGIAGRASF